MQGLTIRPAEEGDAQAFADIYNPYITGTTVSFEETPVTAEEMLHRMCSVRAIPLPWLCAELEGAMAGYAYASRWKERSAYRFTAETTIYLAPGYQNRGIGESLYRALLEELRAAGLRTAIGVIALPNPASVALHEKLGFKKVAHFTEVGFKFNRWLDVGYWLLKL